MDTKLIKSSYPGPASHLPSPKPKPSCCNIKKIMKMDASSVHLLPTHNHNNSFYSHSFSFTTAAAQNSSRPVITEEEEEECSTGNRKQHLFAALQGIMNRGTFGVPSAKKSEIGKLVQLLESQNPNPEPTLCLEKLDGTWKLIYSTITILGSKRTKLGLRDFITLDDIFQCINVAEGKAVNVIRFSAKGLNLLSGELTIEASFKVASKSRVDISYDKSVITPHQLMNVFRKNYDLLIGIFSPDGWLEITYVDDSLRIGRDDKGNIFVLERQEQEDN